MPTAAHCHYLVAETAKALAHELYDTVMTADPVWKRWRSAHPDLGRKALEAKFVARYWPTVIPAARATLAAMLRGPLDPALKDDIQEALILDATLLRGRRNPQQIVGALPTANS